MIILSLVPSKFLYKHQLSNMSILISHHLSVFLYFARCKVCTKDVKLNNESFLLKLLIGQKLHYLLRTDYFNVQDLKIT